MVETGGKTGFFQRNDDLDKMLVKGERVVEQAVISPFIYWQSAAVLALAAAVGLLAAELGARNVRVNCVLPGAVFTEINQRAGLFDDRAARERLMGLAGLHALQRIGTEEEIAEAMQYLICAQWTTGALLDVDGGLGLGLTRG